MWIPDSTGNPFLRAAIQSKATAYKTIYTEGKSLNHSAGVYNGKNKCYVFSCFVKGTKVAVPGGVKNIEDLKIGDLVLSKNIKTGETAYKKIGDITKKVSYDTVTINVDGETIVTTPSHPFWTGGNQTTDEKFPQQWKTAGKLKIGMKLLDSLGKNHILKTTPVKKFFNDNAGVTVYNLMVEDWHDYFVGTHKILVHNATACAFAKWVEHSPYFAKVYGMSNPAVGSVRSQLPIPHWMDYVPVISDFYLFPISMAQTLKEYGAGKISGGRAVWQIFKSIGDHYINEVTGKIFPTVAGAYGFVNTITSSDFANKAYGLVKEDIPPSQR